MSLKLPKKGEETSWVTPFIVTGKIVMPSAPATSKKNSAQAIPSPINVVNPRDYVQVGINGLNNSPVAISMYELGNSNNKDYAGTHKFLFDKGLYMPTPLIFMTHFKNVIQAKEGKGKLYHADGSVILDSEVDELYNHLTTNSRNIFGRADVGAWTWLNARFDGKNILTTTGIRPNGDLIESSSKLEKTVDKDCYINLDFNSQGLAQARSKSKKQEYISGKNIYFWAPQDRMVARFGAGSGGANFGCLRNPSDAYSALGVFGCAEGTFAPKN